MDTNYHGQWFPQGLVLGIILVLGACVVPQPLEEKPDPPIRPEIFWTRVTPSKGGFVLDVGQEREFEFSVLDLDATKIYLRFFLDQDQKKIHQEELTDKQRNGLFVKTFEVSGLCTTVGEFDLHVVVADKPFKGDGNVPEEGGLRDSGYWILKCKDPDYDGGL